MISWRYPIVNTGLFINNEFVAGDETIDSVNPTTGEVIAAVQAGKWMIDQQEEKPWWWLKCI